MNTASKSSPKKTIPSVVLIFGPTAVGKTELLAELFDGTGEVISADSMQVYRGMSIGTAKPDSRMRQRLPHHLLDVRNPDEQFNAGDFVTRADLLIQDIHGRGLIPVVSGGTPFYFKNFIYGLPETPPSDAAIRADIKREIDTIGLEAAHKMLTNQDPEAAMRISIGDRYRVERALEVMRVTGRRISDFSVSDTVRPGVNLLLIGLDRPRKELYARIGRRVRLMFESGLADEVAALIRAGYGKTDPGMRGIGYREFLAMAATGCETIRDVRDDTAKASRRYAKRQLTFFRSFAGTQWFHPEHVEEIRAVIDDFLHRKY